MGSDRFRHREQPYTELYRKASLTEESTSHPSGGHLRDKSRSCPTAMLQSWLDVGYYNFYEHRCYTLTKKIYRQSLVRISIRKPAFLPREHPGPWRYRVAPAAG